MNKETYGVAIECNNCDYKGSTEIEKGKTVPSTILCPNCRCDTAHKSYNKTIPWFPLLPYSINPTWIHTNDYPPLNIPSKIDVKCKVEQPNLHIYNPSEDVPIFRQNE